MGGLRFGPSMVLFAMTVPIIVVIGLIGNQSQDWRREWWTRFGSWIGLSGVGFLAISVTSVFAPWLALNAFAGWGNVHWSTVLGWIATVVGGLFTGNSDKTQGEGGRTWKAWAMELFSKVAAVAFIVGSVFIASTALHLLILAIVSDLSPAQRLLDAAELDSHRPLLGSTACLGGSRPSVLLALRDQHLRPEPVLPESSRALLPGRHAMASGLRQPHDFTGFDEGDELRLSDFSNKVAQRPAVSRPVSDSERRIEPWRQLGSGAPHSPQRVVRLHTASRRRRSQGRWLFAVVGPDGSPAISTSGRWFRYQAPRRARTWATAHPHLSHSC